ncbi:MAG: hypothetical protein IT368_05475, partial [Candidatus Hydrogenedentes bacterium]|nr:hypothetical protein [Candidatus Hydrogenedentota bacterium]
MESLSSRSLRLAAIAMLALAATASGQPGPPSIVSITPNAAEPGTTGLVVQIELVNTTPPSPPANVLPLAVRIGTIEGSSITRSEFTVGATFSIPATEAIGPRDVIVVFPAPPGQPGTVTLQARNGFAIGTILAPGGLQPPPAPPGNPVTPEKALLGKALFWDEQLSSTRTVACGTCHDFGNGGADGRSRFTNPAAIHPGPDGEFGSDDDIVGSPGVPVNDADGAYSLAEFFGLKEQVTERRSMPVPNAAFFRELFWDGRASEQFRDPVTGAEVLPAGAGLESQVLGPPVSTVEMAHSGRDWTAVAARVSASAPLALSPEVPGTLRDWIGARSYSDLFAEVFGTPEITPSRIAMAIATYERTLVTDQTPFDIAQSGGAPLTVQEARGRGVYNAGRCNVCHGGILLSDDRFHYTGVRPVTEDLGRFNVTGANRDRGAFRSPSLRNIALRAPYMHNGRFATLEEVVDFYDRGGDFTAPNKDPNVRPLGLTSQQKADLLAFLRRPLTDPRLVNGEPPFDAPLLYSRSNLVPRITGTGIAGTGGRVPVVIAIEPPLLGNPSFTVAVGNALGGATAFFILDAEDPGADASLPASPFFQSAGIVLAGDGPGGGYASAIVAIPASDQCLGKTFVGRWYVTDPAAANGLAISPAVEFTIFGPNGNMSSGTEGEGEGEGEG